MQIVISNLTAHQNHPKEFVRNNNSSLVPSQRLGFRGQGQIQHLPAKKASSVYPFHRFLWGTRVEITVLIRAYKTLTDVAPAWPFSALFPLALALSASATLPPCCFSRTLNLITRGSCLWLLFCSIRYHRAYFLTSLKSLLRCRLHNNSCLKSQPTSLHCLSITPDSPQPALFFFLRSTYHLPAYYIISSFIIMLIVYLLPLEHRPY